MRRSLAVVLLTLLSVLPAAAQFFSDGNEPAGTRWREISTPDYRVIYPEGLDSLGRVFADWLERIKRPVGATAGYIPNQEYKRAHPVILYPGTASANGMVATAPRRMVLYTAPMFSPHDITPWAEHLVTHESRHVAQMQYINARPYKPFGYLVGEIFDGAASSLYCGPSFFEGDAVAAETELSFSGRGRSAAFLEYYRAAFSEGDMRNFWQWRFGSIKKYTPDYYTIGYIRAAGMRSVYGVQDFTARYYERLFRRRGWPWPLFNYPKTVKEVTGKPFRQAFAEITDTLRLRWERDAAARAPFMPSGQLTPDERRYVSYTSPCILGGQLYAVRSGLDRTHELVRIDSAGKAKALSAFSPSTSRLRASEALGRLFWSEIIPDIRWEMRSYSEIRYCGPDGVHKRLTRGTRWYNPSVSPEGKRLAVTEYPVSGGSAVVVLDASDGSVLGRHDAPDGLQVVESAWVGEKIYAFGISDTGTGIYDATSGFRQVLSTGTSVLRNLCGRGDVLYFVSDQTGVFELYSFDGEASFRLTSSRLGGSDFCPSADGGSLLSCVPGAAGRQLFSTPLAELPRPVPEDFGSPHAYELARDLEAPVPIDRDSVIVLPEPRPYRRLAHLVKFHSWAPLYVSPDAVDELSFESILTSVSLGATGFFQNELETLGGTVAYGAFWDSGGKWSHIGETKFTYSGLYPKLEASLSVSSDPASFYFLQSSFSNFSRRTAVVSEGLEGTPSFNASLLAYVPLNFSSGGWYRGVIPQVRASASNSLITHGTIAPMNRISASLRGYVVSAAPSTGLYPRLGAGLEAGWSGRLGTSGLFAPNAYLYGYGYLPGLVRSHGVRLTGTVQAPLGKAMYAERYVSVLPRGMADYTALASKVAGYPLQSRVTLDYAFPFLPLDFSALCPVAYVRNLECTLHADGSFFGGGESSPMVLGSAGADLCVVLGNLAWLPFTTRIGVNAWWNWGVSADQKPWNVGLVFNMDI